MTGCSTIENRMIEDKMRGLQLISCQYLETVFIGVARLFMPFGINIHKALWIRDNRVGCCIFERIEEEGGTKLVVYRR